MKRFTTDQIAWNGIGGGGGAAAAGVLEFFKGQSAAFDLKPK
jgi:hypothetical protein